MSGRTLGGPKLNFVVTSAPGVMQLADMSELHEYCLGQLPGLCFEGVAEELKEGSGWRRKNLPRSCSLARISW